MKFLMSLGLGLIFTVASISAQADVIDTPADFVVIMDAETGDVVYEKNGYESMAPASMSKLMTIAIVFDAIKQGVYTMDDKFYVSRKAWKMEGSKMWVLVDTDVRIEDLLRGVIVQSGNDACIVLAEGVAGTEEAFAERMTEFGKKIGLRNSTFKNSTGWPHPEHRTTAYDLSVLSRYLINEFPEHYAIFAETEFTWNDIKQENRNPLLFLDLGADGLKTGHTEESGYGLTASAVRDGRRMIISFNGLDSKRQRSSEARRLIDASFREFKSYDLLASGEEVVQAKTWNGTLSRVPLVVNDDVRVVMHRSARSDMQVKVKYQSPLQAPIAAGQEVGSLVVSAPGIEDRSVPLYAGKDVGQVGFVGHMMTAVGHLLYGPPAQ